MNFIFDLKYVQQFTEFEIIVYCNNKLIQLLIKFSAYLYRIEKGYSDYNSSDLDGSIHSMVMRTLGRVLKYDYNLSLNLRPRSTAALTTYKF